MKKVLLSILIVSALLAACAPAAPATPTIDPFAPTSTRFVFPPTVTPLIPVTGGNQVRAATRTPALKPAVARTAHTHVPLCVNGCIGHIPGCDIKGNLSPDLGKIYFKPGDLAYAGANVWTDQGDRWFCTPEQARSNGWVHFLP